jgi:hypothetical protein
MSDAPPQQDLLFISVFNRGALPLALNHLQSLKNQGITENYRAYVTDPECVDILKDHGFLNCELVTSAPAATTCLDNQESLDFGSKAFYNLNYLRFHVIGQLLAQGKTVWYMDVDTVVTGDVQQVAAQIISSSASPPLDLAMQTDINMLCTGCMLCFPTPKTRQLVDLVYASQYDIGDQIVLRDILNNFPDFWNIHVFDPMDFPNGLLYFSELHANPAYRKLQEEFRQSSTPPPKFVHANWMVGNDKKIQAFKDNGLWFVSA